jgi:hypothetical protein
MRIRTIKPEFFTHDRLFEAELEHKMPLRIAFAGLWCAADREGRFKWEPRRLGVQILPYDGVDFSRVLDALVTRGFLVKYATEAGDFGWIPGFSRHQIVNNKERASELPEPILEADSNACSTRESRDGHACHKERKGKEHGTRKGMEGDSEGASLTEDREPPSEKSTKPLCTLSQAKAYAPTCKMTIAQAEHWWHTRNANGWVKGTSGGHPIKIGSWQSDMASSLSWVGESTEKAKQAASTTNGSVVIGGRVFKS